MPTKPRPHSSPDANKIADRSLMSSEASATPTSSDPVKRSTPACDFCRRRKERCTGGIPCKRCNDRFIDCTFAAAPPRYGEAIRRVRVLAAAPPIPEPHPDPNPNPTPKPRTMVQVSPPPPPKVSKRSRKRGSTSQHACQQCRNRRKKCTGDRPSCSNCMKRGSRCHYPKASRQLSSPVDLDDSSDDELDADVEQPSSPSPSESDDLFRPVLSQEPLLLVEDEDGPSSEEDGVHFKSLAPVIDLSTSSPSEESESDDDMYDETYRHGYKSIVLGLDPYFPPVHYVLPSLVPPHRKHVYPAYTIEVEPHIHARMPISDVRSECNPIPSAYGHDAQRRGGLYVTDNRGRVGVDADNKREQDRAWYAYDAMTRAVNQVPI